MLIELEPHLRIQMIEMRRAQVEHILHTEKDITPEEEAQAGILADVLRKVAFDTFRREIQKRQGTIADWAELHVCGQQIALLAQAERKQNPEDLEGLNWRTPQNLAQKSYAFLVELLLMVLWSAGEIEAAHPELEHFFASEREDHREVQHMRNQDLEIRAARLRTGSTMRVELGSALAARWPLLH